MKSALWRQILAWYVFVFSANEFSGELIDSPEGKLAWIKDEHLTSLNLWESDHIFLPWLERGEFSQRNLNMRGTRCADTMWFSINLTEVNPTSGP